MKRYITGILAVVIAISAFAFTKPQEEKKNSTTYTFSYAPTSDFSQAAVELKSNWESNTTPPSPCLGTANKACQADIDEIYTHDEGGVRVLNTSTSQGSVLNISAIPGANNTDYVPDPSMSGVSNVVDKP